MWTIPLIMALAAPEAAAAEAVPVVALLVGPGDADDERAAVIEAHLFGLDVDVRRLSTTVLDAALADKHAHAQAHARDNDALAAVWVESPRPGTLELFVVRSEGREVLYREVSLDPDAPEAGLEALGVVARAVASALSRGDAVDMETIALPALPQPEPQPEPEAEPLPPEPPAPLRQRGRARLFAGYVGTSFAREVPWQSGAGFGASWVWPFGLEVGAAYSLMQRVSVARGGAAIELARHPIEARVGYSFRWRSLFFDGHAALIVDATTRRAQSSAASLQPARDRAHATVGLAPRGRVGVVAVWRVELYVEVAAEFWLNAVRYAVQTADGASAVVLTPRRVRGTAGAGLAVRL